MNQDRTDAQWQRLEPLLPEARTTGRPRNRSRRVLIDGMRWRFRTGSAWYRMPQRYGPHQTVSGLYQTWVRNGTWAAIFDALGGDQDALMLIPWMPEVHRSTDLIRRRSAGRTADGTMPAPGGRAAR